MLHRSRDGWEWHIKMKILISLVSSNKRGNESLSRSHCLPDECLTNGGWPDNNEGLGEMVRSHT